MSTTQEKSRDQWIQELRSYLSQKEYNLLPIEQMTLSEIQTRVSNLKRDYSVITQSEIKQMKQVFLSRDIVSLSDIQDITTTTFCIPLTALQKIAKYIEKQEETIRDIQKTNDYLTSVNRELVILDKNAKKRMNELTFQVRSLQLSKSTDTKI